jgi:hypothetical protein
MNSNAAGKDAYRIREVVDEIDNSCDLKDWTRCRSFFTEDVDVDFESLSGSPAQRIPADALIGAWSANLFEAKKTCHLRSNHVISVQGDDAEVYSKGYAFNLLESGPVTGLWEVWGHYTHRLVRTHAGWKCSALKLQLIHQRGDERVRNFQPE